MVLQHPVRARDYSLGLRLGKLQGRTRPCSHLEFTTPRGINDLVAGVVYRTMRDLPSTPISNTSKIYDEKAEMSYFLLHFSMGTL